MIYQANNNFYVYPTQQDSIKEFKTWLSTHNIEVYYVLAEPEYIPLDDTL